MITGEGADFTWQGAEGAARSGPVPPFLDVPMFAAMLGRALTTAEESNAELLLGSAARRIRDRITDIAWDNDDARLVSFQVVKSAIATAALPDYVVGHSSYAKTVGEKTHSGVPTNPDALLVFTDYHWAQLGISPNPKPKWRFPRNDY